MLKSLKWFRGIWLQRYTLFFLKQKRNLLLKGIHMAFYSFFFPRNTLPAVKNCVLSEALCSLLEFSARYLVLNGRLVYWLPTYRRTYCAEHIPSHPCLKLLYNSEQVLSAYIGRRLITMEKTKEFVEGEINDVDDSFRNVHDRFRNDYFNVEKTTDVG